MPAKMPRGVPCCLFDIFHYGESCPRERNGLRCMSGQQTWARFGYFRGRSGGNSHGAISPSLQLLNAFAPYAAATPPNEHSYRKLPPFAIGYARIPIRAPFFSSALTKANPLRSWMEITG